MYHCAFQYLLHLAPVSVIGVSEVLGYTHNGYWDEG